MIIKLLEDFNSSMPSWLTKEVQGNKYWRSNEFKNSNIDWYRAVYHPDTIPTSSRDPRLKDTNRLAVFRFSDGTVIVPAIDDSRDARIDGRWKPYRRMTWKEVLDNVVDYGYLDLSDANTTRTQIQKDRKSNRIKKRQPQYYDEYTKAWRTVRGYDKSGYKLDPYALQKRLSKYKASKGIGNVIEKYYNRLNDLNSDLKEMFGKISVDDDPNKVRSLVRATDYFHDALTNFSDLKGSIERKEQKGLDLDDPKVIDRLVEWDLQMYGENIDKYIREARSYLADISK